MPEKVRILVLDDDRGHAEATAETLERSGYGVTVATSGAEGLRLLEEEAFDLVVSDLVMRDFSGIDIVRRVKSRTPEAEIIVITGYPSYETALEALNDQAEPTSSHDHAIPRFTWWDHRGTSEWVRYEFKQPRKVSGVEVYWFDDTGMGACRVPKSWRVLWKDGDRWKPVGAQTAYETKLDQFNRVVFDAVQTPALRLEVELKPDFSGGILEWRVIE
jgi:CheY-like chemotaxis protein